MPELFKNFGHDFWKPRECEGVFLTWGRFWPLPQGTHGNGQRHFWSSKRGVPWPQSRVQGHCPASLTGWLSPQLATPNVSSAKGEQPRNGSSPADTSWPPLMGQRGAAHFPGQTPTPASGRLLLPFPNSPSFRFLYDLLMSLSLCPGYDVWELTYPYLGVLNYYDFSQTVNTDKLQKLMKATCKYGYRRTDCILHF